MALLVWITLGVALWHFTVFVPDRFKGGIVGAFGSSVLGAVISGGLIQIAMDRGLGDTDLITLFAAVPGCTILMAIDWLIGARQEAELAGAGEE